MSTVRVEASGQESLDRAMKLLAGIEGGLDKAVRNAMSRAVSHLRTNSAKAIRERYAISAANIRASENVAVRYNYQSGTQALVTFAGQKIPLYRYDGAAPAMPTPDMSKQVPAIVDGAYKWVHPGVAARGHQLKSTGPVQFYNAFTAQMDSGHIGVFRRKRDKKGEYAVSRTGGDAIEEVMGASVPQMLGSEEVSEKLAQDSMKKFEERLDHEVLRILSGWGG